MEFPILPHGLCFLMLVLTGGRRVRPGCKARSNRDLTQLGCPQLPGAGASAIVTGKKSYPNLILGSSGL
jgi:hypothetical protein